MIEEEAIRLAKLKELKKQQEEVYPAEAARTHTLREVADRFVEFEKNHEEVTLVGRIRSIRHHGGLSFATIEDQSGTLQLAFKKEHVGKRFDLWQNFFDIGDFVEAHGEVFLTKRGEKSLEVHRFKLLTKTLLPLPEKWHGLTDVEIRYRQRYLDLLANSAVRDIFKKRSLILLTIRNFLENAGFMEVETPVLQSIPGGAAARPFKTHHQALDLDLYLRIAPELYLKRLIVGGYEKVYELARCFRNEGIDHAHNPEFTQLELYWAYRDYEFLMEFTEQLIRAVVMAIHDRETVTYENHELSFSPGFLRITFRDLLLEATGIDIDRENTEEKLTKAIKKKKLNVDMATVVGYSELLDQLYKKYARPNVIQPTFVTHYPLEMKPLAKATALDKTKSASFQLLAAGMEIANAYNELNDPLEQEARFSEQEKIAARGSVESHKTDHDFIIALKHGLPPTVGFGMGLDRLTALLTNSHSLKEVILFPTLRPEETNIKN